MTLCSFPLIFAHFREHVSRISQHGREDVKRAAVPCSRQPADHGSRFKACRQRRHDFSSGEKAWDTGRTRELRPLGVTVARGPFNEPFINC